MNVFLKGEMFWKVRGKSTGFMSRRLVLVLGLKSNCICNSDNIYGKVVNLCETSYGSFNYSSGLVGGSFMTVFGTILCFSEMV